MLEVNVKEARKSLGQLLDKVEQGQDIIVTRRGKKVAHLVPLEQERRLPSLEKFRQGIALQGRSLSETVEAARNEERY